MKTTCNRIVVLLLLLLATSDGVRAQEESAQPKNVILFVADGAGPGYYTMARDYWRFLGHSDGLELDNHLTGTVQTYASDSRVTDSAASATAYASGIKTYNGAVGVDTLQRPVLTALEAAARAGLRTGLVATSRITHATPAAFSAHVPNRGMENEIAAQQMVQGIEVIFGGGRRHFLPEAAGGAREDERDLLNEASGLGYTVANDLDSFRNVQGTPVISLFTMSDMSFDVDRDSLAEPGLAEMTRKALELLEGNPEGFFLLVEASRIDHAGHVNDPVSALHDMLAYDEAFRVALEFAQQDGETLIVATADHDTGGLTLGRAVPPDDLPSYAATFWRPLLGRSIYGWRPDALHAVRASSVNIASRLQESQEEAGSVFRELAGIDSLTYEEVAAVEIARRGQGSLVTLIGEIISRQAGIGWTSGGHTGVDVNLYAYGPWSERFRGNVDNDVIGRILLDVYGSTVTLLD